MNSEGEILRDRNQVWPNLRQTEARFHSGGEIPFDALKMRFSQSKHA
jgi:hypothetical protein